LQVALRQLALLEAHLRRFLALGQNGEPRRERCSLLGLIRDVEALLCPQFRHAEIDWRWQPSSQDYLVEGNPDQLTQLLLNVLSNGMEAAGPGGWVSLAIRPGQCVTRLPEANGLKPHSMVEIEVTDSGQGPPPEIADRLFEVFVTGKKEGVGLGLAVAQQVAEAHGGILIWRRHTNHTSFTISLPVADPVQEEKTL
jgi:two-component system nitrogen regulation sensor histidine kinase GlnL